MASPKATRNGAGEYPSVRRYTSFILIQTTDHHIPVFQCVFAFISGGFMYFLPDTPR
jgi:hypothetical protein